MPPKKSTGENTISKKSFALIWWVQEGSKDIIPASKLPRKNRTIGSIVKLKWETFKTKQIGLHDAKMIAFDTNYEKLNNILLDAEGNIHDFSDKLFTTEVLQLKRKATEDNKDIKKSKILRMNSFETELLSTSSLFANPKSNKEPSKLPVLKLSTGPVVNNIKVIDDPMNLDESLSSLSNSQNVVKSSSNNQEFRLIDCSKVNNDVSNETNGTAVQNNAAANAAFNCIMERSPPLQNSPSINCNQETLYEANYQTEEPLDFSKANNSAFITTTADNRENKKSYTPSTPGEITDIQPTREDITNVQFIPEEMTGTTSTSGEIMIRDEINAGNSIEGIETSELSIGALHTFMPNDFTEDDVRSFLKVYSGIEEAHRHQTKKNAKLCVTAQISKNFYTSGHNKVKILSGSGLYLPESRITHIIHNSIDKVGNPSWQKFVTLVIEEVYGDTIGHYSANGKRGCDYPGIDSHFYETTLKWVQSQFATEKITRQNYTTLINKIAWKKRTKVTVVAPDDISEENLKFFQKIVVALKKNITWQSDSECLDKSVHHLLEPGLGKAKIWESYNIYFPKNVIFYIERKSSISPDVSNWKVLVKEALLEIYRSEITNFSAKGTRSNKSVGIDSQVFKAVLAWAQSRTNETISETEYVNYINKFIANKRQCSGKIQPQENLKPTIIKHIKSNSCEPKTNSNFVKLPEKEDRFIHKNEVNVQPEDLSTVNNNNNVLGHQFYDHFNWNLNYASTSREYQTDLINANVFQQSMNILHDDYEEDPLYLNL